MITADITVTVPPEDDLVSVTEAKAHVRYTGTAEDTAIGIQLAAAIEQCELVARRAFVTQTLAARYWSWPHSGSLPLPRPPLQQVASVKYTTADGVTHTLPATDYVVYLTEPGLLVLKPTANWPSAVLMPGPAIVVELVAGYGDPVDVPVRYKQAVLLLFGTWFANREHVTIGTVAREMPDAVRALLLTDRG